MTTDTPSSSREISFPSPPGSLIMIVGRNEDTRIMLRTLLEHWNYEVVEARNTDESIALSQYQSPSLILLDTTIDFNTGLDDMSKIANSDMLEKVPSVMISGFSQDHYREAAMSSGATGYLVKPIDFDVLEDYLKTLAGQRDQGEK